MNRFVRRLLLLLGGALLLVSCSTRTEDFRYRLTVEVETPDGLRTGSSVIEVELSQTEDGFLTTPESRGVRARLRGEAVAVDLPRGRVLFALLRTPENADGLKFAPYRAIDAPEFDGEFAGVRRTAYMKEHGGSGELPRTLPPVGHLAERSGYPLMVTFGDLDDPTSVERVDPDDLAATFGNGVRLKRITVEITDDPVTTGIEERLAWLDHIYKLNLSGDEFPDDIPLGDFSGLFRTGA